MAAVAVQLFGICWWRLNPYFKTMSSLKNHSINSQNRLPGCFFQGMSSKGETSNQPFRIRKEILRFIIQLKHTWKFPSTLPPQTSHNCINKWYFPYTFLYFPGSNAIFLNRWLENQVPGWISHTTRWLLPWTEKKKPVGKGGVLATCPRVFDFGVMVGYDRKIFLNFSRRKWNEWNESPFFYEP